MNRDVDIELYDFKLCKYCYINIQIYCTKLSGLQNDFQILLGTQIFNVERNISCF